MGATVGFALTLRTGRSGISPHSSFSNTQSDLRFLASLEPMMPAHRVPDDIKRRRGTWRADRAEGATADAPQPGDEALAEYKRLAVFAYTAAICGFNPPLLPGTTDYVTAAWLEKAERALAENGITQRDGRPWMFSAMVRIAN